MPALGANSIPDLKEVEAAVNGASSDQRLKMLLGLTDLFLASQDGCSDAQIKLFDDVLIKMTKQIEEQALIELSIRLAPQKKVPPNTLRSLAEHPSIGIAGPVLVNSEHLTDGELVQIAKSKSQAHLTMIARRPRLNETITDVLVDYGNADVLNEVAKNTGARISHLTMGKLVFCAERDDKLTVSIFNRQDVPPGLLRQLVRQATERVRAKLMKAARPDQAPVVEEVMRDIAKRIPNAPRQDYADAQKRIVELDKSTVPIEMKIYEFASTGRIAETAAAFSLLSAVEIEAVASWLENSNSLALVFVCKALSLPWRTARAVLALCSLGTDAPRARERTELRGANARLCPTRAALWQGRQSMRRQVDVAKKPAIRSR